MTKYYIQTFDDGKWTPATCSRLDDCSNLYECKTLVENIAERLNRPVRLYSGTGVMKHEAKPSEMIVQEEQEALAVALAEQRKQLRERRRQQRLKLRHFLLPLVMSLMFFVIGYGTGRVHMMSQLRREIDQPRPTELVKDVQSILAQRAGQ